MQVQTNLSQPNFGKSIPVYYYAKDKTGRIFRVVKPENIKKCHQYVIRNLTKSAKNKNIAFIDWFKSKDADYANSGLIRSVYENSRALIYLVTGHLDNQKIKEWAKPVGIRKAESLVRTGSSRSFEVNEAGKNYFKRALEYVKQLTVRKKTPAGEPVAMRAFFDAQYKKDGSLKGFSFNSVDFVREKDILALQ